MNVSHEAFLSPGGEELTGRPGGDCDGVLVPPEDSTSVEIKRTFAFSVIIPVNRLG